MRPPPAPSASGWRLAVPAVVAALLPVASEVTVRLAASGRPPLFELSVLLFQVAWTAAPFVLIAGLVTLKPALRPAWGLAAGVGLALSAVGWTWASRESVQGVAGRGSGDANIGLGILLLAVPVAVFSVMITVIAVRSAFAGGPPRV